MRKTLFAFLFAILLVTLLVPNDSAFTQDVPPRGQTRTQAAINRAGTKAMVGATATQKKANQIATAQQKAIGATQAALQIGNDKAICTAEVRRMNCTQLPSCEAAYACLRLGNKKLDRDRDNVPCENLCPGG
jgi:hypothetical protein